jgi:phenylacetate-CoA ligase
MVVTGGGSKGYTLPPYEQIVDLSRKYFTAKDSDGEDIPAPFMDVLGMTETLTALIDRYGTNKKIPHPLSHVFLLDPKTFEPMNEDKKQGVLGIFNPFVTSWLEIFYPGDLMTSHPSKSYYGKEYAYMRRFTVEEGWDLQRACGGTLEEMMVKQ